MSLLKIIAWLIFGNVIVNTIFYAYIRFIEDHGNPPDKTQTIRCICYGIPLMLALCVICWVIEAVRQFWVILATLKTLIQYKNP